MENMIISEGLRVLLFGMVGIFIVMGIIIVAVYIMGGKKAGKS